VSPWGEATGQLGGVDNITDETGHPVVAFHAGSSGLGACGNRGERGRIRSGFLTLALVESRGDATRERERVRDARAIIMCVLCAAPCGGEGGLGWSELGAQLALPDRSTDRSID